MLLFAPRPSATARDLVDTVARIAATPAPVAERLEALAGVLEAFVQGTRIPDPETWRDTTGRYTRVLLNDPSDPFQVVAVFWPPGARSAIHDHDATHGAVMPVFGRVSETKYSVTERADGTVDLVPSRSAVLEAHTFSPISTERGEQLHDVVNDGFEWACTLHVYLRGIDTFNVYAKRPDGHFERRPRTLWFDYTRGWADWDRAAPRDAVQTPRLAGAGRCLCGAVRFEFRADPSHQLVCHCTDCQRWTGTASAPLAFFPAHALKRMGQTARYDHTNDSGHTVGKEFCPRCGTPLFHRSSSAPHLVAVPAGTLDDGSGFRATTEIYVDSAPPWARAAASQGRDLPLTLSL